jgi:hypothetical protein
MRMLDERVFVGFAILVAAGDPVGHTPAVLLLAGAGSRAGYPPADTAIDGS